MLELEKVHKSFEHNGLSIHVLRGIDLIVEKGQTLAVLGASGAGKSTLLNIMGTLEQPSEGVVRFENRSLRELGEGELCALRSRRIGFVFQFHHLLPEFNALENAAIPAFIAREGKREAMGRAEEILVKVGLGQRLSHRVGELSGGEQQRVAIARALVMKPALLLADEPTGNLDAATGEGIVDLLLQLNKEETLTMVIATHNQRLAERMLRQAEIMDGRLRF
ncbi:MAG: ABC transporter ATP-binding protein [Desulfatiglandales bacterium]